MKLVKIGDNFYNLDLLVYIDVDEDSATLRFADKVGMNRHQGNSYTNQTYVVITKENLESLITQLGLSADIPNDFENRSDAPESAGSFETGGEPKFW